jgi:hypothetical protein
MVQLREPDAGNLPSATVLKEVSLWENWLTTSDAWYDNAIDLSNLTPGQGLCLVINRVWGNGIVGRFQYDSAGGSGRYETADTGGTWSSVSNQTLLHYAYGTYSTSGLPKTVTRQHITAVRMALHAGDDANSQVGTSVQTYNTPEALSAYWELDFNADPRIVDSNADGAGDWVEWATSSGVFNPADLVNGVWNSPNAGFPNYTAPNTVPDNDFTELTTVDARYRATSVGGWGATIYVNADRSGNQCAPLVAVLQKPDAASQELKVGNMLPGGSWDWFATLSVPDDFVNVRLIINPANDTLAVFVDGVHRGTYIYSVGRNDNDAMAWVYSDGCSGAFDYVRIRVGGNGS